MSNLELVLKRIVEKYRPSAINVRDVVLNDIETDVSSYGGCSCCGESEVDIDISISFRRDPDTNAEVKRAANWKHDYVYDAVEYSDDLKLLLEDVMQAVLELKAEGK